MARRLLPSRHQPARKFPYNCAYLYPIQARSLALSWQWGDAMKLSLRLIPILAVAITIVTFSVARNQVRSEKRGLRADLERRAEILAESLQEIVEPALDRGSHEQLRRVVERFGIRYRLAGVVVYDARGEVLAESSNRSHGLDPPHVP